MNKDLALTLSVVGMDAASGMLKGVQGNVNNLSKQGQTLKDSFASAQQSFLGLMKAMAVKGMIDSQVEPFKQAAGDLQEAMLAVKANIMSGFDKGVEGARQMNEALDATSKTAEIIAKNMRFSKTEVVSAQNELLKAGIAQGMVTGTKENKHQDGAAYAAASLAQLSGLDLKTVIAPWLGNMGDAFNFKKASQYTKFADHVARVDDAAATKVEAIQYNVQQSSASAAAMKISPEKLVSMMGYASSLGNEAGTSVGRFIEHAAGMTPQSAKALQKMGIHAFKKDAKTGKNEFVGIDDYIAQVRTALSKEKDEKKRMTLIHKAFGEQGGRFANLVATKDISFADFENKVATSASLTEKLNVTMSGYNASVKMLEGSFLTLRAELGSGLLPGLTSFNNKLNDFASGATAYFSKNKGTSQTVAWGATAVGLAAGGAAAYYGVKTLIAGAGGLKGAAGALLGKGSSVAGGVAMGKALQATAGITPVFVTNFPDGMGGGKDGKPKFRKAVETVAEGVAGRAAVAGAGAVGVSTALAAAPIIALAGAGLGWQAYLNSDTGTKGRLDDRSARQSELQQLLGLEREGGASPAKIAALQKQIDAAQPEIDRLKGELAGRVGTATGMTTDKTAQLNALVKQLEQARADKKDGEVAKLTKEVESQRKELLDLMKHLEMLTNRPVQVQLDGRVIAESVNSVNGRDSRRQ